MPRRILVATGLLLALSAVPLFRPRNPWDRGIADPAPPIFQAIPLERGGAQENLFTFRFGSKMVSLVEDLRESECSPRYRLFSEGQFDPLFQPWDPGISGFSVKTLTVTDLDRDGDLELALTHREPCGGGGHWALSFFEYADGEWVAHRLPTRLSSGDTAGRERFLVTPHGVEVSFPIRSGASSDTPSPSARQTIVYGLGSEGFELTASSANE